MHELPRPNDRESESSKKVDQSLSMSYTSTKIDIIEKKRSFEGEILQ